MILCGSYAVWLAFQIGIVHPHLNGPRELVNEGGEMEARVSIKPVLNPSTKKSVKDGFFIMSRIEKEGRSKRPFAIGEDDLPLIWQSHFHPFFQFGQSVSQENRRNIHQRTDYNIQSGLPTAIGRHQVNSYCPISIRRALYAVGSNEARAQPWATISRRHFTSNFVTFTSDSDSRHIRGKSFFHQPYRPTAHSKGEQASNGHDPLSNRVPPKSLGLGLVDGLTRIVISVWGSFFIMVGAGWFSWRDKGRNAWRVWSGLLGGLCLSGLLVYLTLGRPFLFAYGILP